LYLLRLGAAFDVSCGADLLPEFLTLNKWQYDLLTICLPPMLERVVDGGRVQTCAVVIAEAPGWSAM
jgi:hypothetical protein